MGHLSDEELKKRIVRGGAAKLCGQAVNFALRLGFMVVLARLLSPHDFGLVAMVMVVTGFYGMFTTGGLSAATVQKAHITDEEVSTLFWINIAIGAAFAILCIATAPLLVAFYREPKLFWIAVSLAAGFLFTGAGVQHSALLQRQLRYSTLTTIETLGPVVSSAVGIGMAIAGFGYWALVAAAVAGPVMTTAGSWLVVRWRPGRPRWSSDIRSMLLYGGTITMNTLVSYTTYNLEKVLLGRFWGADILGLYGRAYQLISVPTEYLNGAIGGVAFSALSRLQDERATFKAYFLRGYTIAVSMTMPITIFCAVFADELILVLFGPNWSGAATIFRLLAPTVLIFGIINPFSWLLLSLGLQGRSLRIALAIAPLVITAYAIGLPYGPTGVATAYSIAMTLWVVPHVLWCVKGTVISAGDIACCLFRPFLAGGIASSAALVVHAGIGPSLPPIVKLMLGGAVMFSFYAGTLLFVLGEKDIYFNLVRSLFRMSTDRSKRETEAPSPPLPLRAR
jgi:PST family polysaccharide transporter